MASRWRRCRTCRLDGEAAALRTISATSAIVDTIIRPPLGSRVALDHPDAGRIEGEVIATTREGVRLALPGDERAMGFALAALAADMTTPP